jgi:phosphohistidine phosphatase
MRTLSLLRHAKSSWADPGVGDFDRPLNERGKDAAPRMGAFMADRKLAPDLILCSTAARARQTLDLVLPQLSGEPAVLYEDALYLAAASALLRRVRKVDAAVRHLMLVGHDPGLHALAVHLAGEGAPEELEDLRAKLPTAGLAMISFNVRSWSLVKPGAGHLKLFMTPKRLPGPS